MISQERRSYHNTKIHNVQEIYELFEGMEDSMYQLNWLVCSTSGVHGSYISLDDIESGKYDDDDEGEYMPPLTVLVIFPRRVQMIYGNVDITKEDIPKLRTIVTKSIAGIAASQAGNRVD